MHGVGAHTRATLRSALSRKAADLTHPACVLVTVVLPLVLSGCSPRQEVVRLDEPATSEGATRERAAAETRTPRPRVAARKNATSAGCELSIEPSEHMDEADAEAADAQLDAPRVKRVYRYARTAAKADLAALWVDEGIPVITVARNFDQHRGELMQLVGPDNVVVRRATFTQRQLREIHRVLSREMAKGAPWSYIATDEEANRVVVGLGSANTEAAAQLRSRFPDDAICIIPPPKIEVGPAVGPLPTFHPTD